MKITTLKKLAATAFIAAGLLMSASLTRAQGLTGVTVEKYYISNAADSIANDAVSANPGTLPTGSVTYRIYLTMTPGYKLQAVYGTPTHTLSLTTSTLFYNSEDAGAGVPNGISVNHDKAHTNMLDSWISVGAAASGKSGVLKSEDTDGSLVAAPNGGLLQGASPVAGIPVNTEDGMITGSPDAVTAVGFDPTQSSFVFNNATIGNSFVTNNGAWSDLTGASGPNANNRVLIGQFTTTGTFSYNLNVQIGTPSSGTLNYVASGATGGEINFPTLAGSIIPDVPPTVSITSPSNGAFYITGAVVADSAIANDAVGISRVEFFVDGVSKGNGTLANGKYSIQWTSTVGAHILTAVATDNDSGQTTSSPVTINVHPAHQPYGLVTTTNNCESSSFCQMIAAEDSISNVIGYDVVLNYNASLVTPTGNITVQPDMITTSYTSYITSINAAQSQMLISIYFNASAPPTANFSGIGNLFCVEFNKNSSFTSVDTALFTISSLQESYFTGVQHIAVDPGSYITHRDSSFSASLEFWYDNSPLKGGNSTLYLPTYIYGNSTCNSQSATAVQPDANGNFNYNIVNGLNINIVRDIAPATDVQPVINGYDAFLTRRVLINDPSFVPTVYQAIAMDVNEDGVISAGDLSQISQRAVLLIPEFKQAWNYNSGGAKIAGKGNSNDWSFIPSSTVIANASYSRSTTFPGDDGIGFSKYRVPVAPVCLGLPNAGGLACQFANGETYYGILVGDVDGNFASVGSNGQLRTSSNDEIVFDLSKAVVSAGYVDVPVSVLSTNAVNALDFSLQFNDSKLTYIAVNDKVNYLQDLANYNSTDNTLKYTSYSMQNYDLGTPLVSVRFAINGNSIDASDLSSVVGYLNGNVVPAVVNTTVTGLADLSAANFVSIYPNPAKEVLNVSTSVNATVQLFDMNGREVIAQIYVNANEKKAINTSTIAAGVYTMKVSNDKFVSVKQVVINK